MCSPFRIPVVKGVALDDTYRIFKDRGEIRQYWYDEIAALPAFLKTSRATPTKISKRWLKILAS
jgi:hypothetical protein